MLLKVLDEVYFGKIPEMKKIETQLDKFRQKYMGCIFSPKFNSDKDLLQFNRMIEKQFNIGCFTLHIIQSTQMNAFTISIDHVLTDFPEAVADQKSFKFNKNSDYTMIVCITPAIIFNNAFTTEEVLAIIMHEIGHNFYFGLNKRYGVMNKILSLCYFIYDIIYCTTHTEDIGIGDIANVTMGIGVQKIVAKIDQKCRKDNNRIMDLINYTETILSLGITVKEEISMAIDRLLYGTLIIPAVIMHVIGKLINPFTYIFMPFDYNNEKTADNFATMYGYGPALSSALPKLEPNNMMIDKILRSIPIISNLYNINLQIAGIIASNVDCHPNNLSRMNDQLELLKYELNKNDIDPKMKKYILADIKACEKEINKTITLIDGVKDKDLVDKVYNKFLYDHFKSKELKDYILTDRNRFEGYDKIYNKK